MNNDHVPAAVAAHWLAPRGIQAVEPITSGMSDAKVFRCQDRHGNSYALKRWPSQADRSRIEQVHGVIQVARGNGCTIVPEILASEDRSADQLGAESQTASRPTLFADSSGFWELAQWMPGKPLAIEATGDPIRAGAVAIASFHRSVRNLGVTMQPPPAVLARLRRQQELDRLLPPLLDAQRRWSGDTPELSLAIDDACGRLRSNWAGVRERITRSLTRYADMSVETQYVLRDVHRQHLLFRSGSVSGLIDFDAIRVDTPMTDLARWVGSFSELRESIWEAALAGYCQDSPSFEQRLSATQQTLAKEICFATTWISLANWVIWIVGEKRSFPAGPRSVATRIGQLVRLCNPANGGDL